MMKIRILAALAALCLLLGGCGANGNGAASSGAPAQNAPASEPQGGPAPEESPAAQAEYEDGVVMRVASLSGPTSMGISQLAVSGNGHYDFQIYTAASEIVPLLVKGEVDAALIPANLAANVCQQTSGGVRALNINTLGVLEVVAPKSEDVQGFASLAGRTVYLAATGKGATPEYAARTLMQAAGLEDTAVTLDFSNPEPANVLAALAADPAAIAILPQPFATVAVQQNEGLEVKFSLSGEWEALMDDGSKLVTGVTVVRTAFAEEHPAATAQFALDQAASVSLVNADPESAGQAIETLGIVKAPVAAKAIPRCNLVCISGSDLRPALEAYLDTLYGFDPAVVGGAMPDAAFYLE